MLVLSHADGLGVDFHQLRQRVLQPSGNRSRAPLPHVKIRELLRCQLACGIHGSARFVYNHILNRRIQLLNQLHNHLLRLSRGRSVPHADKGYAILFDESF